MLKFGKKITYRPLLISLLIAFLPGIAFGDILNSVPIGLGVGFLFFLFVFFAYYFPNIPTLFVYWESDKEEIRYCDIYHGANRLLGMIIPAKAKMITIQKSDIKSITAIGNLNSSYKMPMAIPYTASLAVLSPVLSMIKHPEIIRFNLKDGSSIDLSIARDYTYSRDNTLEKLDTFFNALGDIPVTANMPKNK